MNWWEESPDLTEEDEAMSTKILGVRPASAQKETAQRLAPFQSSRTGDAVFKPGDKLIFKPEDPRSKPDETEVISVGRKWVQLSRGGRADKETGQVDGGKYSSPGKAWTDADLINDDYRRFQWSAIKQCTTGWKPPRHLTNEQLDQIAAWLEEPTP